MWPDARMDEMRIAMLKFQQTMLTVDRPKSVGKPIDPVGYSPHLP
jgi:hypothetical protein